jgi:flagellar protein FlbD
MAGIFWLTVNWKLELLSQLQSPLINFYTSFILLLQAFYHNQTVTVLQKNQTKIWFYFGFNRHMISLSRLNGSEYYVNADMIMTVEGTPDTVITLNNSTKFVVKDPPQEVVKKIIRYQQIIHSTPVKVSGD